MAQHLQWIDIDECVNQYIDESEQSDHKYFKLWQLALRGLQELGIDFFYQIRSVRLPVQPNYTVQLPADYQNYTKVGILNGRGEIIPLSYNNKLTTFGQLSANRVEKTKDNSVWDWYSWDTPVWFNYWNGNAFTQLYGIPSGAPFVGSFKIDNHTGIIVLDQSYHFDYIMLEYVATPLQGQIYRIPVQFRQAMISWLAWNDISSPPTSRRGGLGDKQLRSRRFYNDRRLAWARYRPFNIDQAYEDLLKDQRKTIKS